MRNIIDELKALGLPQLKCHTCGVGLLGALAQDELDRAAHNGIYFVCPSHHIETDANCLPINVDKEKS